VFGTARATLEDWLDVHEYLVGIVRKFHDDVGTLQRFASDIIRPFEQPDQTVFADWIRMASERVRCLKIVFEDSGVTSKAAQEFRLRNLDSNVLGDGYREGSIEIDPGATHFDLMKSDRLLCHIDEMVTTLRSG